MRDEDLLIRLRELLSKEEKTLILVRKNPDLDTMAGATALYLSFSQAGKSVNIVCPTEPIVELSSLVGIDKVSPKPLNGGKDLTIILPYEKGKIEKISYNIEGDKIHLVVKGGVEGLGFEPADINFLKTGTEATGLVFLVGIADPRGDLLDVYNEDLFKKTQLVKIGNIESQDLQGINNLQFVDPSASSVSETVANILNKLGAPLDADIAQNLLNGISFATNNFQSEKTTPLAFEMAAFLLRQGAKRQGGQKLKILEEKKEEKKDDRPPLDWLTPKIYKGSTLP